MEHDNKTYEVYEADREGNPGPFEATYDTVAEVLAHCEENVKPYAIRVDGHFLSLDRFMETHVSAG
jgi:sulfur carrier protein ThiS